MKRLLVMLSSVVFLCVFATSAMAEWGMYGHARMGTWWTQVDKDLSGIGDDDLDFSETLQTNARIGADVTTGDVKGKFEYGTTNGVANIRLLYGSWEFAQGTLLVGQNYTPVDSHMVSNVTYADDALLLDIGIPYEGRLPQIQVIMGDLVIAAVKPCNTDVLGIKNDTNIDTYIPKLEIAYNIASDSLKATLFGGFNTYKVEDLVLDDDYDLYSGVVGARCMVGLGDAYVNGALFYAMNAGNYGLAPQGGSDFAMTKGDDVENSSSLGGVLVVGSKMDDTMTVEGGAGYVQNDIDGAKDPDATMAVYAQLRYTPIKAVCIVPEIGYVDYMDDAAGETEGSKYYAGAKWQINF